MQARYRSCRVVAMGVTFALSAAGATWGDPPAVEKADAAPKTRGGADSESAGQLAEKLAKDLAQEPKKIAELARERAAVARAKLLCGRELAVWRARARNAETSHVELQTRAEQAARQRTTLRGELDAEIERVRQQFEEDKSQCDQQLHALIQSYLPRLDGLKDEAAECKAAAAEIGAKLAEARRQVQAWENQERLAAKGRPIRALVKVAELKWDERATKSRPPTSVLSRTTAQASRSVEDILKDLDR